MKCNLYSDFFRMYVYQYWNSCNRSVAMHAYKCYKMPMDLESQLIPWEQLTCQPNLNFPNQYGIGRTMYTYTVDMCCCSTVGRTMYTYTVGVHYSKYWNLKEVCAIYIKVIDSCEWMTEERTTCEFPLYEPR